tara:strand:+ start:163 stop:315 length:153 start_codon:yes stop_codon:yes gene_type:complete
VEAADGLSGDIAQAGKIIYKLLENLKVDSELSSNYYHNGGVIDTDIDGYG